MQDGGRVSMLFQILPLACKMDRHSGLIFDICCCWFFSKWNFSITQCSKTRWTTVLVLSKLWWWIRQEVALHWKKEEARARVPSPLLLGVLNGVAGLTWMKHWFDIHISLSGSLTTSSLPLIAPADYGLASLKCMLACWVIVQWNEFLEIICSGIYGVL